MRRAFTLFSCLTLSIALLTACGGSSGNGGNDDGKKGDDKKSFKNMKKLDLSSKGPKLTLQVPKKDPKSGIPPVKVSKNARGGVKLKAGDVYGMTIMPGAPVMGMKQKKKEIKTMHPAYTTKFLTDKKEELVYKFELSKKKAGTKKEMYHFYMVSKVGGNKYVISSLKNGTYSHDQVKRMLKSAKSLKPKGKKKAS